MSSSRQSPRPRALVWAGALALALGLGAAGCPFELPRGVSCGDNWWDEEYEQCDPTDRPESYIEACRDQGFMLDAHCDPQSCTILAEAEDCNFCGDGVAADGEDCDGDDLGGETCAAGLGTLRCTSDCTYDYDDCPAVCGDDIVNGDEECEIAILCVEDGDCDAGVCYDGNCIEVGEGFLPVDACANYETTAIGFNKPYASGSIGACAQKGCYFGRNECSFCGDGELDPSYSDLVAPEGTAMFPAEICDGDEAILDELEEHCEPLCVDDPINSDVTVLCDFECSEDCLGFKSGGVVPPDPESLGCCLAEDSPCPKFGTEGVPSFPCCSWLENPEWLIEQHCVPSQTGQIPVTLVCP